MTATAREKLMALMKERNETTYSLARRAEIAESSIKNIIYNKSNKPGIRLLKALARELECDLSDLLADNDPRKEKISNKVKALEDNSWDSELHIACIQAVNQVCEEMHFHPTTDKATHLINSAYQYAKMDNSNNIDFKFIKFIIRRDLSNEDEY